MLLVDNHNSVNMRWLGTKFGCSNSLWLSDLQLGWLCCLVAVLVYGRDLDLIITRFLIIDRFILDNNLYFA